VVFIHVWALHVTGSNNPAGVEPKSAKDTLPFHPYFTSKDSFALVVFLTVFLATVFFAPLALTEFDHFKAYDSMVTPPHIVPEWYFLPFYAILKSFVYDFTVILSLLAMGGLLAAFPATHVYFKNDAKKRALAFKGAGVLLSLLMLVTLLAIATSSPGGSSAGAYLKIVIVPAALQGVLAMFGSILLLVVLPWLDTSPVKSARYRPLYRKCLLILLVSFIVLGYAGAQQPEGWPVIAGQIATLYYFAHFLVIVPYLSRKEKTLPVPNSIHEDPRSASKGN